MIQYIVLIGASVNLTGTFFYIRDTLNGKTKPNRVSWLIWAIAPMIGTVAALFDGVRWAVLPIFIAGLSPFLVFIASFLNSKAYWKLGNFDYICGGLSILALVLGIITKEPLIAILFSIASDGFGVIPTIKKSFKYPDTESAKTYMASLFSASTSFFALRTFELSELAFPIYLVPDNTSLMQVAFTRMNFDESFKKELI